MSQESRDLAKKAQKHLKQAKEYSKEAKEIFKKIGDKDGEKIATETEKKAEEGEAHVDKQMGG